MRRFVMLAVLGLLLVNFVGCGGAEKAPSKPDANAPQPPGEPKDGP